MLSRANGPTSYPPIVGASAGGGYDPAHTRPGPTNVMPVTVLHGSISRRSASGSPSPNGRRAAAPVYGDAGRGGGPRRTRVLHGWSHRRAAGLGAADPVHRAGGEAGPPCDTYRASTSRSALPYPPSGIS